VLETAGDLGQASPGLLELVLPELDGNQLAGTGVGYRGAHEQATIT
jgi:hypothetical protein